MIQYSWNSNLSEIRTAREAKVKAIKQKIPIESKHGTLNK